MTTVRCSFLKNLAAAALAALPGFNFARSPAASTHSNFAPQPGQWRTFEINTRADIAKLEGTTKVWLPISPVNSNYQQSLKRIFSSNGSSTFMQDGQDSAKMRFVEFAAGRFDSGAPDNFKHQIMAQEIKA